MTTLPLPAINARPLCATASALCALSFIMLVVALHVFQPGYDPREQLMSELALGRYGLLMLPAFICLALATLLMQCALSVSKSLHMLFGLAALGFTLSGLFALGEHSVPHIAAISAAFVFFVLGMCAFARDSEAAILPRALSWLMAAGVALSVALGHDLLPMGIAQRLAAACLLSWLLLLDWRLIKNNPQRSSKKDL